MPDNPVCVGRGVWVAPASACDAGFGDGKRVIHLAYPDAAAAAVNCRAVEQGRTAGHLLLAYRDGEPFREGGIFLEDVARYAMGGRPLLIHCAAGICRSPTLAVAALIARGDSFDRAVERVWKAMLAGRGVFPDLRFKPMTEIAAWAATWPGHQVRTAAR
jgi:hypothetical protein